MNPNKLSRSVASCSGARVSFFSIAPPQHQTYCRKLVTDSIEISFLSLLYPLLRDVDNGIVELVLALLD